MIDEPVIVTSEDVPSAGVEGEESVEVLVTDDTGDVVTLPATQEIIQEVGEVGSSALSTKSNVLGYCREHVMDHLVALIHFLACSIGGVRLRDSNKKNLH